MTIRERELATTITMLQHMHIKWIRFATYIQRMKFSVYQVTFCNIQQGYKKKKITLTKGGSFRALHM